jgi:hypothetical protein
LFSVVTKKNSIYIKVAHCYVGTPKKCERSRLLGTWYLTVFPQKIGTKLFIFHTKFFYRFIVLYIVLALESISGVKIDFLAKKNPPQF